jgi:hypothetical protein
MRAGDAVRQLWLPLTFSPPTSGRDTALDAPPPKAPFLSSDF